MLGGQQPRQATSVGDKVLREIAGTNEMMSPKLGTEDPSILSALKCWGLPRNLDGRTSGRLGLPPGPPRRPPRICPAT